jgi:hypothetical protein
MTMSNDPIQPEDREQHAIAARLAKLRERPVDLSRLKAAVDAQLRPDVIAMPRRTWTPLRIAAGILVMLGVGVITAMYLANRPTQLTTQHLAQVHEQMPAHGHVVTPVSSISQAYTTLTKDWANCPPLPQGSLEGVKSCCIHHVAGKRMACVEMMIEGEKVSMTVADADDVKMPPGRDETLAGIECRSCSHGGVNMVMVTRDGRWICVMGKLPRERLARMLADLRA